MKNKMLNMTLILSDELKYGYSGVSKKIENEIRSFESNNISVRKVFAKKNTNIHRLMPFSGKFEWPSINSFSDVDIVYIRYGFSDYGFIRFLKRLKKYYPDIIVLIEIGTYPYIKELKGLGVNPLVILRDEFYCKFLHKYVDRIVTFRKFESIFNTKVLYAINCADMDKITVPKRKTYRNDNIINLVAVAQIEFYYGYDRLIKGIANYYKNNTTNNKYNVIFHIVGDGTALEDLKLLASELDICQHVVFHGFKTGNELDEIYEMADVGIDCFGGHRKDDYLGFGTLKTREYFGKGLPFVTEYTIPEEVKIISKYILNVPTDESDIDVGDIIEFYEKISKEPKLKILDTMRDFAYSYCHISVAMNSVVEYINKKKTYL